MEVQKVPTGVKAFVYTIHDLPNEVLEFILGFLLPYKDLVDCMCVCRRWNASALNVMQKAEDNLYRAIKFVNVKWKTFASPDSGPTITKRFSHAACIHENSMYIFGGCTTNSTAFNDLWRFDLSNREWIRPLAMGKYPMPKAYSTMVPYKDNLIVFGGWTSPMLSSIYGCWSMFNEIHSYNITNNRWVPMKATKSPPPMAGHSATIRDNTMIVYGGMYKPSIVHSQTRSSSDVWVLDLKTLVWFNHPTTNPKPPPRYGQSLIVLDNDHIMILGGIKSKVYTDCWMLRMTGSIWTWIEVAVKNKQWAATHIWCKPACRVGDKVVTLGYEQNGPVYPLLSAARMATHERVEENYVANRFQQNMMRVVDNKDNNVNGRRGVLPHHKQNNNNGNKSDQAGISNPPNNEECVAGPSGVPRKSNDPAEELVKVDDNVNKNDLSDDDDDSNQKENIAVKKEENESNDVTNRNFIQICNTLKNKAIAGRKYLPNGLRIARNVNRDPNNIRMAAFAIDPSIVYIPPAFPVINPQPPRQPEVQEAANAPDAVPAVKKVRCNTLALQVLDIAAVFSDGNSPSVSWMKPQIREMDGAPEEVIMYSLVRGKGELIMFGGLNCNADLSITFQLPSHFSNSLHFITPPRNII